MPVAQGAKPPTMLALTTSEKSIRVPTYGMTVEWSDQAERYLNLDFISLSIARQVANERNARANEAILALLNGDADVGQGALSGISNKVKTAVSLDSAASSGLTQKAWMLWLHANSKKRRLTHLITDINGALTIEARANKPTNSTDNPNSTRIDTVVSAMNPTWGTNLPIFIMDADSGWPANTIMGIDARYAIQRVVSSSASYSAIESFALTRTTAMRFDFGSITRRLYADAFEVLTYS
jgi:hypothetical protein